MGRSNASLSLLGIVRDAQAADASWRYFTSDGRWICPFCLSPVVKRPNMNHESSCAAHLERCSAYALGRGQQQPEAQISARLRLEQVSQLAQYDLAWRVYDHEGVWFCPGCLDRVQSTKLSNGQISGFTTRAMSDHVGICAPLLSGQAKPVEIVERARDTSIRRIEIERSVREQITFPSWRYASRHHGWICPCCLEAVPDVQLTATSRSEAIRNMALHLLEDCPAVRATGRIEPRGEDDVRDAVMRAQASPTATSRHPREIPREHKPQSVPTHSGATSTSNQAIKGTARTPAPGTNPPPRREQSSTISREIAEALPDPEAFTWMDSAERTNTPITENPALTKPAPGGGTSLQWMDEVELTKPVAATPSEEAVERTDVLRARDLQEDMLADAPEIPGWTFATRFMACEQVSGDFYEFIRLSDGRIGFAIGDVSGHGIQAGLIMSMAKKTLEIFAATGLGPADALARVNEAIARDLGGKMFVSMCYGVLDPEVGTITWARAGHTPPIHVHADGTISEIKPRGMVVGMKTGKGFRDMMTEETMTLERGEAIVLYTDGITESMNRQKDEFGTERLFELIKDVGIADGERLLDEIVDRVRHFRGGPADDDMTMLTLIRS